MKQHYLRFGNVVETLISEDLKPIRLTVDLFKKLKWKDETGGWGGSTGMDYVFSKEEDKLRIEIRTVDYDNYWHITNFDKWALKVNYLHELQAVWFMIFRKELELE